MPVESARDAPRRFLPTVDDGCATFFAAAEQRPPKAAQSAANDAADSRPDPGHNRADGRASSGTAAHPVADCRLAGGDEVASQHPQPARDTGGTECAGERCHRASRGQPRSGFGSCKACRCATSRASGKGSGPAADKTGAEHRRECRSPPAINGACNARHHAAWHHVRPRHHPHQVRRATSG